MKTTKKLLSLLAIAAMTVACSSSSDGPDKPDGPGPVDPPITTTKYPADSNPDKFDNFFKRTMVVDHTGTTCPWCPYMVVALNKAEESADGDKIVVIASHTWNIDDPMYNQYAVKYKTFCKVTGYPQVNLDLRSSTGAVLDYNDNIISKCNALETKYPAKVAIAAAVELVGTNFVVHTGVKVGVTGTYNIGIIVLEDNIKAKQSNKGAKGYDFSIHKHAVRGGFPYNTDEKDKNGYKDVTGEPLREGTINAGELIEKDFTVPVPAKTKAENAKIVVYVACPDTEGGTKFYINNAVVCKPGSPVAFKYK